MSDSGKASLLPQRAPRNPWLWLALLVFVGVSVPTRVAVAGSRSSLVFVSVRVVESCRIDAIGSQTGNTVDLNMRCNSAARPSVNLQGGPRGAGQSVLAGPGQPSTTMTGAQAVSSISLAGNGSGAEQVLRIDF